MRTLSKRFGDRVLINYPTNLLKDLELQNKEIEKNFTKTLERLNDKNVDKKKAALNDLGKMKDISKIQLFWNTPTFRNYLKKSLYEETQS